MLHECRHNSTDFYKLVPLREAADALMPPESHKVLKIGKAVSDKGFVTSLKDIAQPVVLSPFGSSNWPVLYFWFVFDRSSPLIECRVFGQGLWINVRRSYQRWHRNTSTKNDGVLAS